ncbi:DUF3368 domain-containing protein [Granulicella sp. 5B5]|uniref:DUF3368 domain-containing protein n=1 Tax=Granulicella sp. 5B5 TaxID=1617967 RepID=UPI0015F3FDC3|nr:DUF3368 domain-containing protein [Granulicella sp. 5B5]QMV19263.1 DUF3368 domain-containing protein [Granulicella sp. 5B5]
MIFVADTGPLNYLILIGHIDILRPLYGEVVIPPAVQQEMLASLAPPLVRSWMSDPPPWLEVRTPGRLDIALNPMLDEGEWEAIALAYMAGQGSVVLIDDRVGRLEASRLGFRVTGTLGILEQAHKRGLLNIRDAIQLLRTTNFKASEALLQSFSDLK